MTRKDAIEAIKCNWPDSRYTILREALDMAISALREQDAADKDVEKWISVKDRMPEPGVNVLARCFYHECWQMFVCHVSKINTGHWYTGITGQWVQVTHWMPLPEPPEEKTI